MISCSLVSVILIVIQIWSYGDCLYIISSVRIFSILESILACYVAYPISVAKAVIETPRL